MLAEAARDLTGHDDLIRLLDERGWDATTVDALAAEAPRYTCRGNASFEE